MFGKKKRHAVNEVFTPRRTDVNKDIYVDRVGYEKELKRVVQGSLHAIVFGESGSGKSWLYKKVLSDLGAYMVAANCANALRFGSLTQEIAQILAELSPKRMVGTSEEIGAQLKAVVAEGGAKATRNYEQADVDPLLSCLKEIRKAAGNREAVLVIENLELIFESESLMDELASVITLLDDSRYAEHKVKILIVGTPSHIKEYFSRTIASVANRLTEVSEVASLSRDEIKILVRKGFVELLSVEVPSDVLVGWQEHIATVTMGFAQHVQEYCEQLAYVLEDHGWIATIELLEKADAEWLKRGLSQASVAIASLMNERETRVGRRNQVLYALGKIQRKAFHVSEVETVLRDEFPNSTADTTLAVGQILTELSGSESPIIKRSAKGPTYEFKDARFAMALRVLLKKEGDKEKVAKVS